MCNKLTNTTLQKTVLQITYWQHLCEGQCPYAKTSYVAPLCSSTATEYVGRAANTVNMSLTHMED